MTTAWNWEHEGNGWTAQTGDPMNGYLYADNESWSVEIDDGARHSSDGLPTILHEADGLADGLTAAKAKAIAEFERWTEQYISATAAIDILMQEAEEGAAADEAAGVYDQPAEDDAALEDWIKENL